MIVPNVVSHVDYWVDRLVFEDKSGFNSIHRLLLFLTTSIKKGSSFAAILPSGHNATIEPEICVLS